MSMHPATRRRPFALAATLALSASLLAGPLAASDTVVVEPVPSVAPELPAADAGAPAPAATTAPAVEVAAAKMQRRCQVTLNGTRYTSLWSAEAAAVDGDTLSIAGRCAGLTEVDTDITIVGTRVQGLGRPVLPGARRGQVLSLLPGAAVVVRGLTMRGGVGSYGGAVAMRSASLELLDVRVIRNRATRGGAIHGKDALVVLRGRTAVARNTAGDLKGGGLYLEEGSTLRMHDRSRVARNTAVSDNGGGIFLTDAGTLEMHDRSRIARNISYDSSGAGIYADDGSTITMNDDARIARNIGYGTSAGVNAYGVTLTMHDRAQIAWNVGEDVGGYAGSTLVMNDASRIHKNTGARVGGATVTTALTMNGTSSISGNRSTGNAGGPRSAARPS